MLTFHYPLQTFYHSFLFSLIVDDPSSGDGQSLNAAALTAPKPGPQSLIGKGTSHSELLLLDG